MAAKDQAERGKRTKFNVGRKLAKTPKSAERVAFLCGISVGLARRYLKALHAEGRALTVKQPKGVLWMGAQGRPVKLSEDGKLLVGPKEQPLVR